MLQIVAFDALEIDGVNVIVVASDTVLLHDLHTRLSNPNHLRLYSQRKDGGVV